MNSIELIDKKEQLKIQAENILSGAEKESRKMTDEETNSFNKYLDEIKQVDEELRSLEMQLKKDEKKINNNVNQINNRSMEQFSLLKTIKNVVENKQFDERSAEVINAGATEMRNAGLSISGQIQLPVEERADVQATVTGAGMEAVATDKLNILEPLRANLVMAQAGATLMTGLVGNVSIPVYSGSTVGWEGEIDPAKDGAGAFSEVEFTPKRLTAYLDISKQFLLQDSVSAEAMLRADIIKAISTELEATILGDEAGNAKKPEGLFYNAGSADATYDGTVDMEEMLEDANVYGEYTYIVSPKAKAALRKAPKGDHGFVMEDGEINGINVLCTSASKGIVLGNFSEYVIAQWGAIDLTVDPYTQAAYGKVRLVINAFFDAKPRRSEAFVAGTVD